MPEYNNDADRPLTWREEREKNHQTKLQSTQVESFCRVESLVELNEQLFFLSSIF
jgi:hypothetical protein